MSNSCSPVKFGASLAKKAKLSINWDECIICQDSCTGTVLYTMASKGKETFLNAIKVRKGDVFSKISAELSCLDDLKLESTIVKYHKSCYASYTSKHNLKISVKSKELESDFSCTFPSTSSSSSCKDQSSSVFKRSDWSTCFFCKRKWYKKDRKLRTIETVERVNNILEIAKANFDFDIEHCVLHENFLGNAVYHQSCMTNYMLKGPKPELKQTVELSPHDVAFQGLIAFVDRDLIVDKKAFTLASLVEKFNSYLPDGNTPSYPSFRLQSRLQKYYGDAIVVQSQQGQGQSNIIFSSAITLGDAIKIANTLKTDLKLAEVGTKTSQGPSLNDEQILYSAASILRQQINNLLIPNDFYPTSTEVSLSNSLQCVPSSLTSFLCWLLGNENFNFNDKKTYPPMDKMRKYLAIAETIIAVGKSMFTPFHIGLAIQLHNDFGSKHLIDTLNSHGMCSSYDEVRRYLTNLANFEIERFQSGSPIPNGICSVSDGGFLVQEGCDNIDVNAETVDGKNTFHSMARAIFQVQPISDDIFTSSLKVPRTMMKSLPFDETTSTLISCLPFSKPKVRPEPPRIENPNEQIFSHSFDKQPINGIIWVLLRFLSRADFNGPIDLQVNTEQIIPFWTGFHSRLSMSHSSIHFVAYAPVIDSKPSDMATVFTTMKRSLQMAEALGQTYSVQTFDQQLYAVAKQVQWAHPELFRDHIIRLGGFHALSCFIGAIGKLWSDGGLRDMLVDSGVYAGCTVDQMLSGKQFNRAVRDLTVAYDALMSLMFRSFFSRCATHDKFGEFPVDFWPCLQKCYNFHADKHDEFPSILYEIEVVFEDFVLPLLISYIKLSCNESPTFKYWHMFLTAVSILLQNIKAERTGSWSLHLTSVTEMLPYFFATNKVNYSRWMPVYIIDMIHLPFEVRAAFLRGEFSIRQTSGAFKGVWSDMRFQRLQWNCRDNAAEVGTD